MTLTSVSHAYSKWLPATCCSVSYSNTRQSFNPVYYSFSGERAIYYQHQILDVRINHLLHCRISFVMRYALMGHSVRFAPTNRKQADLICHSDQSVSLVLYRGGVFAISSYERKATSRARLSDRARSAVLGSRCVFLPRADRGLRTVLPEPAFLTCLSPFFLLPLFRLRPY